MIEAHISFAPIPGDFVDIDDVVAEHERNPERAGSIARARIDMAEMANVDGNATLATLRLRKGFSQKQLAQIIGTSQPRLSRIECGLDDILLSTFEKLAAALEVTRDNLAAALSNSCHGKK